MIKALLIHDNPSASLIVPQVLARMNIATLDLVSEEFHPEFLATESFDLIVFEISGENKSCVAALKELEKWTVTSGSELPPVIVVSEDNLVEQDFRRAKVTFFFIKPVIEQDLVLAITQANRHHAGGPVS